MKKPPVFEVSGLRVEREAVILRSLSWRVDAGQHWVVLGANGSGKTSLLSAITGYLIPTRGEIRIGGDTFGTTDWREVRQSVGLVSSSLGHNIEPEMGRGRRRAFRPRRADQLLEPTEQARHRSGAKHSPPRPCASSTQPPVAGPLAGRTPARAHRSRVDGESCASSSSTSRALALTPSRARTSCASSAHSAASRRRRRSCSSRTTSRKSRRSSPTSFS